MTILTNLLHETRGTPDLKSSDRHREESSETGEHRCNPAASDDGPSVRQYATTARIR